MQSLSEKDNGTPTSPAWTERSNSTYDAEACEQKRKSMHLVTVGECFSADVAKDRGQVFGAHQRSPQPRKNPAKCV